MKSELLQLTENIKRKSVTSLDQIRFVEKSLGIVFPKDYVDWMLLSNGGAGLISENSYVLFWSLEQVVLLNQSYRRLAGHIPSLILFGSDGGEERYAFDTRSTPFSIIRVRLDNLDIKSIVVEGKDFIDFLRNLKKK